MPRVVCPLCKTGFEASITRERCAINCVACTVAFDASTFLTKEDYSAPAEKAPAVAKSYVAPRFPPAIAGDTPAEVAGPALVFAEPATNSTRTGGLPFVTEGQTQPMSDEQKKQLEAGNSQPVHDLRQKLKEIRWKLHAKNSPPAPALQNGAATAEKTLEANGVAVAEHEPKYSDVVIHSPKSVVAPVADVAVKVPAFHKTALLAEQVPQPEVKPKKNSRRPLLEGTFGPYEIDGEIARGGVGAVFRGREKETGREIALKVLLEGPEAGESERERFQHECETAKALSLPGMVQVYAVGEIDGRPYMAMELVRGRSLDKVIPEKTLSVNDCLVLMKSVSETIGALHEAGYVHRDLKPGNILIDEFHSPKVADFGLVKSLDEITRLTASGLVCGTPAYMAPEQARGDGKAVDPRSDVWALGAVLYEMLSCKPPFQAENALRLMLKITKEQPRPLRVLNIKVPQDVQYIVMKCLEKTAERRYANARALAVDINRFLNGEPLEIRSQSHERVQKMFQSASKNKRPLMMAAAGLAALAVMAVAARIYFQPREAGPLVEHGYAALSDAKIKDSDRLDSAQRDFNDALAIDPKNARAYLGLGLVLGRRGIDKQTQKVDERVVAEAISATRKAAELDPQLRADSFAQAARINMWMKKYVEEAQCRERAVELAPNSLNYREALAMAYWNAGALTNQSAYYRRAVTEFQYILNAHPTYPKVRDYIRQLQEQFLVQQQTPPNLSLNNRPARR